jgi:hypothetical protein
MELKNNVQQVMYGSMLNALFNSLHTFVGLDRDANLILISEDEDRFIGFFTEDAIGY